MPNSRNERQRTEADFSLQAQFSRIDIDYISARRRFAASQKCFTCVNARAWRGNQSPRARLCPGKIDIPRSELSHTIRALRVTGVTGFGETQPRSCFREGRLIYAAVTALRPTQRCAPLRSAPWPGCAAPAIERSVPRQRRLPPPPRRPSAALPVPSG